MRLSSLLILAIFAIGTRAQTYCTDVGQGTWTEWTASGTCPDCEAAGTPTDGIYRIRLCIPPQDGTCIYDKFTCDGDATEHIPCPTTVAPLETTTLPPCGEWSPWACICCGGCLTSRCTRTCEPSSTPCEGPIECPGENIKEDSSNPCTTPSQACNFPLTICCENRIRYVNVTGRAVWCKNP